MDRATRCVVSWDELGRVGTSFCSAPLRPCSETMQPLADAVWQHSPYPPHAQQRRLFYSDQLDTYSTLVYRQGTHQGHTSRAHIKGTQQPQPNKSQTYRPTRWKVSTLICTATCGFWCGALAALPAPLDHCWITAALGVAVGLLLLCYNRRCLTLERAWHRLWPLLRANCASASSDEIAKQRQRLRRRLL